MGSHGPVSAPQSSSSSSTVLRAMATKRWRTCSFSLKLICCFLFLCVYFAIFLQESMNAQKHQKRNSASSVAQSKVAITIRKQTLLPTATDLVQRPEASNTHNDVFAPVESPRGRKQKRIEPSAPISDAPPKTTKESESKAAALSPLASLYEYSDELNAAVEKDFAARNNHLAEQCENLKLSNVYPPNARELFISPGHNLVWCPVYKAASSLWLFYFNLLGGGYSVEFLQRTRAPPLELARKKFPRPTEQDLEEALATSSTSFLIVRDPFERLVSAYRNKLEGGKNKFYKELGERIVRKFRKKKGKGNKKHRVKGPTFEEFIRYVVDRVKTSGLSKINEHWAPIYYFCAPCTINYTLIVKTETLARDSEYVLRHTLVESILQNVPQKAKLRSIANRAITDTKSVKFRYFSELNLEILNQLMDIYGPDFKLFGYNSTAYVDALKPAKGPSSSSSSTNRTTTVVAK